MEGYAGTRSVGIDLHRRRSVIVRMTDTGQVLETVRIHNDVERLTEVIARAGEAPEVARETTARGFPGARASRKSVRNATNRTGRPRRLLRRCWGVGHRLREGEHWAPVDRGSG